MGVERRKRSCRDPWPETYAAALRQARRGFVAGSTTGGKPLFDRCYARSIEGENARSRMTWAFRLAGRDAERSSTGV